MTTLIVSSPHSLCNPKVKVRECDTAAGLAAQTFCNAAQSHKSLHCIYLPGDEYRRDHDLNRIVSRDTPYRQKLNKLFETVPTRTITIDVHSFPDEYLDSAGDINFFKKGEIAPEVVILEGPMDISNGKSLSQSILAALIKRKVNCKIVTGITVNDILNDSAEHGISAVLLEFNERFIKYPDRLYDICETIVSILASV